VDSELIIRSGSFAAAFAITALWEMASPRRRLTQSKPGRWFNNLGIILMDTISVRVLMPAAAVNIAAAAEASGWGLLNQYYMHPALAVVTGILLMDCIIYLQHLMFHAVPILWRLHMVHHADLDIDCTTGLRFHPVEIIISAAIKMAAVAVIGPPVAGVIAFEIILNAAAMFNHGNINLPAGLDRILRLMIVTPDMHRVHHSVIIRETNSNFGFNFPWWNRLFGTYRSQPAAGHTVMTIGLSQFREPGKLTLLRILLLPLTGDPGAYSLNRIGADPKLAAEDRSGSRTFL